MVPCLGDSLDVVGLFPLSPSFVTSIVPEVAVNRTYGLLYNEQIRIVRGASCHLRVIVDDLSGGQWSGDELT